MKNSAWYHKLWREKLNTIPIKESSDNAWSGMKNLLDQHIPVNLPIGGSHAVSFGTKIFKLIGYTLPVVVTIAVITYINLPIPKESQLVKKKGKTYQLDSLNSEDIKTVTQVDTSRLIYSNENKKNIVESTDIQNTPPIFKGEDSTKENNIIVSSTFIPKFPQTVKVTLIDTLVPLQRTAIIIPKIKAPPVYFRLEKNRKNLHKKKDEKEKLKAAHSRYRRIGKVKRVKIDNIKRTRNNEIKSGSPNKVLDPSYNYGIEGGTNFGSHGYNFYAGFFGKFALRNEWLVSMGFNVNGNQNLSGEIAHPSYFRPDSLPPFIISDSRNLAVIDIPLRLEYRLSKIITLNAGTIISFPIKQSSIETKLKPVVDYRDTVFHSKEINYALSNTSVTKINIGLTGGISMHFKRFDIKGSYQWFNPYRVENSLGFYNQRNRFLRVGIAYRFK